jgi:hypothetical protein
MVSLQALCHLPPMSPHQGANGMWVSELEETSGCVPALWDGARHRGGGVSCRLQTTAILPEQTDLSFGVLWAT